MNKNSLYIILIAILYSCGTTKVVTTQTDSTNIRRENSITDIRTIVATDWAKSISDKSKIEIIVKYDTTGRKQEERTIISNNVTQNESNISNIQSITTNNTSVTDSTITHSSTQSSTKVEVAKSNWLRNISILLVACLAFWLLGRFKIPK